MAYGFFLFSLGFSLLFFQMEGEGGGVIDFSTSSFGKEDILYFKMTILPPLELWFLVNQRRVILETDALILLRSEVLLSMVMMAF